MSPDGKNVYVAGGNLVRLDRNTTSGEIIQPAGSTSCIFNDGSGCADGRAVNGPGVAVSPDGKSVYNGLRE